MSPDPEQLTRFLEWLRDGDSGFEASDHQYLQAYRLLDVLVASNDWSQTVERWTTLLAPLLCSSPAEQDEFYRLFRRRFSTTTEDNGKTAESTNGSGGSPRSTHKSILVAACGLIVVAGSAAYWLYTHRSPVSGSTLSKTAAPASPEPRRPRPDAAPLSEEIAIRVVKPSGRPLSASTLWFQGMSAVTGLDGTAHIRVFETSGSHSLLITHGGFRPVLEPLPHRNRKVTMQPGIELAVLPGWAGRIGRMEPVAVWLIRLTPLLLFLLWVLQRVLSALQLRKWTTPLEPHLRRLGVPIGGMPLFRDGDIRALAIALRRRRVEVSGSLDADSTVEATARRAGYFTPVLAKTHAQPEYLVLGHRQNLKDHKSRLADELIANLRNHDVAIDRYYFQSDPRVCSDSKGKPYTLGELAALHAHHEVWLWTDANRCIDSVTGTPEPWIADLRQWKHRVLLSPNPPPIDLDMSTTEPTRVGLEAMASRVPSSDTSRLPGILADRPERWLESAEPPPAAVSRLLAQLQRFIGSSGYIALKGCAVYPAISWNITATIVAETVKACEVEEVMYRLAELPWFRHGLMPDWLRGRLVSQIGSSAPAVRAALRKYLDQASEAGRERPETLDFITSKRALSTDGPIRDYVYLSFITGRKINPLNVQAPSKWRRFIKEHFWAPLALAAALAVVGTVASFAATDWLADRIREGIAGSQQTAEQPLNQWVALMVDIAEALNLPLGNRSIAIYSARASDMLSVGDPLAEAGGIVSPGMGAKIIPNNESRLRPGHIINTASGELALVRKDGQLGVEVFGARAPISRDRIQWIADLNGVLLRPIGNNDEGTLPLPPIPSCDPVVNAPAVLSQIAQLYQETRQKMPSGDPRTARMNGLFAAATGCESYVRSSPAAGAYFRDFETESDGFRIVALGLAEARPAGRIHIAIEAIRNSRSAFEQYHGLILAENLVGSETPTAQTELRKAIETQMGQTITLADLSRWEPAQALLKYLSGDVQRQGNVRITVTADNPPSFRASGGTPPYRWSVKGTLPAGFLLTASGEISGSCKTAGVYDFSVIVLDATGTKAAADGEIDCTGRSERLRLNASGQPRRADDNQQELRIVSLGEKATIGRSVNLSLQYTCNALCTGRFLEATLVAPDGARARVNDRLTLSIGTFDVGLVISNTIDSNFESKNIEVCIIDDRARSALLCSTFPFGHNWEPSSTGGGLRADVSTPYQTGDVGGRVLTPSKLPSYSESQVRSKLIEILPKIQGVTRKDDTLTFSLDNLSSIVQLRTALGRAFDAMSPFAEGTETLITSIPREVKFVTDELERQGRLVPDPKSAK
jgi:hypothetical protein